MFEYPAKLIRVIDGDTIVVEIDLGFKIFTHQILRLKDIDTAEIFHPKSPKEREEGIKAKIFVEQFLKDKKLLIKTHKTGKYGRWLAEVFADGENLNQKLLLEGYQKNEEFRR